MTNVVKTFFVERLAITGPPRELRITELCGIKCMRQWQHASDGGLANQKSTLSALLH